MEGREWRDCREGSGEEGREGGGVATTTPLKAKIPVFAERGPESVCLSLVRSVGKVLTFVGNDNGLQLVKKPSLTSHRQIKRLNCTSACDGMEPGDKT